MLGIYVTTLHSLCLRACCNVYSVLLAVQFAGVFILFTDCIYMFRMILRTNRRDFSKQHQKEFAIIIQKQRVFHGAGTEFVNVTYLKFFNISPQSLYCLWFLN